MLLKPKIYCRLSPVFRLRFVERLIEALSKNRALGIQFLLMHYDSSSPADLMANAKLRCSPDPLAVLLHSPTIPPSESWYQQEVPLLVRLIAVCCSMMDCCAAFVRMVRSIIMHKVCERED